MAGRKVAPGERINTRSVGFNLRQINFFDLYPEEAKKLGEIARKAVDDSIIAPVDPKFLSKLDERRIKYEEETQREREDNVPEGNQEQESSY